MIKVNDLLMAKHTKRRIFYVVSRVIQLNDDTVIGNLYRLRHDGVSMDTERAAVIYKGKLLSFRFPDTAELPEAILNRIQASRKEHEDGRDY